MPYAIKHLKGGFKVKKDIAGPVKYFSKEPMPLERAKAQMRALYVNMRN
jgi:hypothetical protein